MENDPDGVQAKEFILPKNYWKQECDFSSKMKTHALERITGAVKEQLWVCIWENKAIGHTKYPSADSLPRMLIDLNPDVEAKILYYGWDYCNGGQMDRVPEIRYHELILMSTDPVALDSVFQDWFI